MGTVEGSGHVLECSFLYTDCCKWALVKWLASIWLLLHVCLFASSFSLLMASFDMLYAEYATVKIYGIAISLDT